MFLPRLDHWVSLHTSNLEKWKPVRWLQPRAIEDVSYHSVDAGAVVDYVWDKLTPVFALSGYFAMQLAYVMGASQIILCGCPGSPSPRFFEYAHPRSFGYNVEGVREQIEHEMKRLPDFRARVRSMSGWTKEFFGGI